MGVSMRTLEQGTGTAYSEQGVTILFRNGDSLAPLYLFGAIPTAIDEPERYGLWGTKAERTQYVRAFIADRVIEEQRPLIVSDAFYARATQFRPSGPGMIPESRAR
jgi:hypothetical protein